MVMVKILKCLSLGMRKCFARFVLLCCFSFLFSESYGVKVQLFKLDSTKIQPQNSIIPKEIWNAIRIKKISPENTFFFLEQICLLTEDRIDPTNPGEKFSFMKDFTLAPEFGKTFQENGILAIKAISSGFAPVATFDVQFATFSDFIPEMGLVASAGLSCKEITNPTDHQLRISFPQGIKNDCETFVSIYCTPPPEQRVQVVIHQVTCCLIPSFVRPQELPRPPDFYRDNANRSISLFPHFVARFERPAPDALLRFGVSFQERPPMAHLIAGQLTFLSSDSQLDFDGPPSLKDRAPFLKMDQQFSFEKTIPCFEKTIPRTQRILEFQEPLPISVLWSREVKPPVLEVTLGIRRLAMPRYAVVFFNSYTDQSRFQRLRYFQGLNVVTICIPDITPSPQNHGMWYCGPVGGDYYGRYAAFVRDLISAEGIPESQVLLMGSSMGGFMALKMAEFLPEASVFAYNPQTDFMRFLKGEFFEPEKRVSLVTSLLGRKLTPQDRLDTLIRELEASPKFALVQSASIDPLQLVARPESRRRCIAYFQHVRDEYHFTHHYTPFLQRLTPMGTRQPLFQEERFQNPSDFRIPHPGILVMPFGAHDLSGKNPHLAKGSEFEIPIIDKMLQFMEEQRLLAELRRSYQDLITFDVLAEIPPAEWEEPIEFQLEPVPAPDELPAAEPPSPDTPGDESETGEPEKPGQKSPEAGAHSDDEPPPA
jgi:pimeloyl-ACP methyl ester carboxylesterase